MWIQIYLGILLISNIFVSFFLRLIFSNILNFHDLFLKGILKDSSFLIIMVSGWPRIIIPSFLIFQLKIVMFCHFILCDLNELLSLDTSKWEIQYTRERIERKKYFKRKNLYFKLWINNLIKKYSKMEIYEKRKFENLIKVLVVTLINHFGFYAVLTWQKASSILLLQVQNNF